MWLKLSCLNGDFSTHLSLFSYALNSTGEVFWVGYPKP